MLKIMFGIVISSLFLTLLLWSDPNNFLREDIENSLKRNLKGVSDQERERERLDHRHVPTQP
ncbi:exported hypothetical protein [Serratia proteamaculans]|nr:exported hypothetical protein [Serratia proteamaculans]